MGGGEPPVLDKDTLYSQWKRDILIWQLGTSVEPKRQAARAVLKMSGKIREHASRVPIEDLGKETGLVELIKHLDKFYEKDATQELFLAIESLENYRREKDESIIQYIEEFNRRFNRINELFTDRSTAYNDGVLAYRLLKQASLSENDQKLVRATISKLSFEEMEKALKRCLGDGVIFSTTGQSSAGDMAIKSEPIDNFHAECKQQNFQESVREYNSDLEENELYYQSNQQRRQDFCSSGKYSSQNDHQRYNKGNKNKGNYYNNRGSYTNNRGSYSNRGHNNKGKMNQANNESDADVMKMKNSRDPRTGEIKTCLICQSTMHFAKMCPHQNAHTMLQSAFDKQQHNTFNIDDDYESILLVKSTKNRALIDTGATTTVCGEEWLTEFLETLSQDERKEVIERNEQKKFRFGDGKGVLSEKYVVLPINLCGKDLMMGTFVIKGNLPLLFSRSSLKEFDIDLDIKNDKIMIDGQNQELIVNETGHYVADLMNHKDEKMVMMCTDASPKKMAKKLHRYFGHPSSKRLKDMIQNSEYNSKELITEIEHISENCESCKVYNKDRSRPKVSLLIPNDVNDILCMDLKTLSTGHLMFHAIDLFSRFSSTTLIPNKNRDTIISALFKFWITIFGRPNVVLTDNGGEFVNESFKEMCEQLEITIKTTAGYAPYSNGVCERHNGIIAESYDKLIDELHCEPAIALAWATNAKNSLENTFGYSPYMMILGKTPSIPGLSNVKMITSLNETTVSKILLDHLNCMYQSRAAFLKANNSERVKRSLRDRICHVEEKYVTGDQVYYKKHNQKRWSGPASVIGQEGKQVFVRQGGYVLRVHVTKVILRSRADKEIKDIPDQEQDKSSGEINESENSSSRTVRERPLNKDTATNEIPEETDSDDTDNEAVEGTIQNNNGSISQNEQSCEIVSNEVSDQELAIREHRDTNECGDTGWKPLEYQQQNKSLLSVKAGDRVRYKKNEEESFKEGIVLGRAGKASGALHKNNFNIQMETDDKIKQIHLDKVICDKWSQENINFTFYIDDEDNSESNVFTVSVPKSRYQEPLIKAAMAKEMEYWDKYKVYSEVRDTGQKVLSTRWVITTKGQDQYKARLVVRGFEEEESCQADSPTGEKTSMRILLTIVVANNWLIESIDIKGAFLQSGKLDRIVYAKPPAEYKKMGLIWKLEKPVYGLVDSARNWYKSLATFLLSIGCQRSSWDKAMFYYKINNKLCGIMLIHVDDFIIAGNTQFKKDILKRVLEKYDISKHSSMMFKFIGMTISQTKEAIKLEQYEYANSIQPVKINPSQNLDKDRQLNEEEVTQYRSLLGKLQWLANISRPDIKFDVFQSSRVGNVKTVGNLMQLNKIVTKLGTEKHIIFRKLDLKGKINMIIYSDAAFKNLDNKVNSGRGYLIFLNTDTDVCCLTWNSNKTRTICSSTLEAEAIALRDGVKHAEWLRAITIEAIYGNKTDAQVISLVCFIDSKQLYDNLYSTKYVTDHSLRLNVELLKEKLQNGIISEVRHVATKFQLADPLTKAGVDIRKLDSVLMTGKHRAI